MEKKKMKSIISGDEELEFQQMSKDVQRELQEAGYLDEKGAVIPLGPPLGE